MGLTISDGINDFYKEASNVDLSNKSLLMLGKQDIYMDLMQMYLFADRMGVTLQEYDDIKEINGHVDAVTFFKCLGFAEVYAMDVSDYEGADVVFDLNSEVLPDELQMKFDYIIDGGTCEHVFNIANALNNIVGMLKIGGKVYHYLPSNDWINHGFYSISPCLLNDFYTDNGFKIEESNIILGSQKYWVDINKNNQPTLLEECLSTVGDYRMLNLLDGRFERLKGYKGIVRCIATKKENRKCNIIPIQRHWYEHKCKNKAIIKALKLDKYDNGDIAIWGMGKTAKDFVDGIHAYKNFRKDSIKGFFSNSINVNNQDFDSYPILNKEKILDYKLKIIIIAANDYENEIYADTKWVENHGIKIIGLKKYEKY